MAAVVIALDTEREQRVVGRKWDHRPLGPGQMHVQDRLLRQLGAEPEVDRVVLSLDLEAMLTAAAPVDVGVPRRAGRGLRDAVRPSRP